MTFHTALAAFLSWDGFRLEPGKMTDANFFGLAQFLSTMALLVVVFNVSDFSYRYRLAVRRFNVRKFGILTAAIIGISLLLTEFWFQNSLPTPHFVNNYSNITLTLAAVFLTFVLYVVAACFRGPPAFRRSNAKQFFEATNFYIHQGNNDRLQTIAEEITFPIARIFEVASKIISTARSNPPPFEQRYAHTLLLTIADRRFCHLIVDRVPSFAIRCFDLSSKYPGAPFAHFSRNIGEEFIVNTGSAFYQENSGFESGFYGITKPITNSVFGNYRLVERCGDTFTSPLDLHYETTANLNALQMKGFKRASLAFLDSYLRETKAQSHSYTLSRVMGNFEDALAGLYKLSGSSRDTWRTPEYQRLECVVSFIKDAINSLDKHNIPLPPLEKTQPQLRDIFDEFANLIFETVFASTSVSEPPWTCWSVQHNTVWSALFSFERNKAFSFIRYRVRRRIYDEIRHMDNSGNFKGARLVGFCLNVLGLTPGTRGRDYEREEYALRICVINWTKRNYRRLIIDHPKVAAACLVGTITYDEVNHRLVKTFANDTRKVPVCEFLTVD